MFQLTMTAPDLKYTDMWLGKFESTMREPLIMSAGVKPLGIDMQNVFATEGHGRWQQLTATTMSVRTQRGYPPAHPILVQSGTLKNVTANTLANWRLGVTNMSAAGPGVAMAGSVTPLSFTARVSGDKVENHFGANLGYPRVQGAIPPRPFFGFTEAGLEAATKAIVDRFITVWAGKNSKAKVI